jgi:cellulose synthase/poly-beta-1,6-N-acetylglucosamine synthase-like glycosyltransferase
MYILFKKWHIAIIRNRRDYIFSLLSNNTVSPDKQIINSLFSKKIDRELAIDAFIELSQTLQISAQVSDMIKDAYELNRCMDKALKKLSSIFKFHRISSAIELCHFSKSDSLTYLNKRFIYEKDWHVKFYLSYALAFIHDPISLPVLIESMINAPVWYREKVPLLICKFTMTNEYIEQLCERTEPEIRDLLFTIAHDISSTCLAGYLLYLLSSEDHTIAQKAASAMKHRYYSLLFKDNCLKHPDPAVRKEAIESATYIPDETTVLKLISLLNDIPNQLTVIHTLTSILTSHAGLIPILIKVYNRTHNTLEKNALRIVLAYRLEYLVLKLGGPQSEMVTSIISEIIGAGHLSSLIGFLNHNHDIELENTLLDIIKSVLKSNNSLAHDFSLYLNERILHKLALTKSVQKKPERPHQSHPRRTLVLSLLLVSVFLTGPVLFALLHRNEFSTSWVILVKQFILDFNFALIYYSFTINALYFILLLLSATGSIRQSKYASIKKNTLLFERNMMPSISIIAPAYNESATIIESVNSLINLWYPRYELIVVNDGSSDGTLDKLINYFELVKVDILFREHIATQHILAIYRNPAFPKLTVINKLNGGKADSLNAGINIASGEYVCGIDADSLLEKDALMRIASTSLDIEVETVAVGGNIFPVNGCTISRGCIDKYALPSHPVALFQMIEYFRAFMAGRIGWASLNSLLIISGAFGLFSRKRMLEVGGYLTSSGQYHYDTVGEDMELVVRLSRYMRENKQPFKINYAYNANCWTEVPEDVHILLKQRDRWHRGLIEILSFHAKLFLNPSYGKLGMLSIPYFVLFEMIGPWIELQGYSMVILALSFGLLNIPVLILLFIATIMTGTFISTASLIIAGHEMRHFTFKEILKLIGYSILENFGIRQFVSLQRCLSYVNIIRSKSGWGKMTRKGFTNANQSQTITKP